MASLRHSVHASAKSRKILIPPLTLPVTYRVVIDFVSRGTDIIPPVYWHTTPKNVPVDNDYAKQKNVHVRNAKVLTLNVTWLAPIVDPTKFSSWPRLVILAIRVVALKDVPRTQQLDENAKHGLWEMAEVVRVLGRIRNAPLSFDIQPVYLTCVQNLSTSAFMQALERFTSVRGAASALIIIDIFDIDDVHWHLWH